MPIESVAFVKQPDGYSCGISARPSQQHMDLWEVYVQWPHVNLGVEEYWGVAGTSRQQQQLSRLDRQAYSLPPKAPSPSIRRSQRLPIPKT